MHDKKLKILENISDDLIDACAAFRYKYYLKKSGAKAGRFGKTGWISTIAAMLCLVIGASIFVLIWKNNKSIPVYTGMTLSSENTQNAVAHRANELGISLLSAGPNKSGGGKISKNIKTQFEEEYADDLSAESGAELFYAKPNEDFYITVHISNPNNYEILSFTLNGVKYSSYMFETGSDMENLILKCNPGDAEGLVRYTIDAIKYIDGDKIKDVRMQGERTVEIAVYTENQPTATVENVFVDFNSVAFTATAHDPFGLLGMFGGSFYAVIDDGENILYKQEILREMTFQISFDKLNSDTEYTIAVVGVYDALDGQGRAVHILTKETVTTPRIFAFSDMEVGDTTVSFTQSWADGYGGDRSITSLALYSEDTLISELSPDTTKITGLLAGHTYRLVAKYANQGHEETSEQVFTTAKNAVPKLSIAPTNWSFEHIAFSIKFEDKASVGKLTGLELLDADGNLIRTLDLDTRRVDGLDRLELYTVRATYTYDLRDGAGSQTLVSDCNIATQTSGLEITDGEIVGIGSCTETELYLAMPIGEGAFWRCETFDYVYLSKSVTSIGNRAFSCESSFGRVICCEFSERRVTDGDPRLSVVFDVKETKTDSQSVTYAVQHNGNMVVIAFAGRTSEVVLPSGVTEIGANAFEGNKILKKITLPEGVTVIRQGAFNHATALETVILPSTVTSIGEMAFWWCNALKTINLNDGITQIGDEAFDGCWNLTEIHIPKGITKIGTLAFNLCERLTEVIIPDSVKEIADQAFVGCNSLQKVYIPASVVKMNGDPPFRDCGNESTVIYCEANARPSGWVTNWCGNAATVVWGATIEQYYAHDVTNPDE